MASSNLYPRADISDSAFSIIRRNAMGVVMDLARGTNGPADITTRAFLASDTQTGATGTGGATPLGHIICPTLTANTFTGNLIPNCATLNTQAFGIFAIQLLTVTGNAATIDQVQILVGGVVVGRYDVSQLRTPGNGNTPERGVIDQPIFIPPQTQMQLLVLSGAGNTISTELLNLVGWVGEQVGNTVTPQKTYVASDANAAA